MPIKPWACVGESQLCLLFGGQMLFRRSVQACQRETPCVLRLKGSVSPPTR